jgi:hypothetical protein
MCRAKKTRQYHDMNTGNKSFKMAEQFKYLERTLTNKNTIRKEF